MPHIISQDEDRHLTECYGTLDADEETAANIKSTLKEIGLDDIEKIRIKRLNEAGKKKLEIENTVIVFEEGELRYLFINDDWFKKLPTGQQHFIIGHEGVHLKYDHIKKSEMRRRIDLGIIAGTGGISLYAHKALSDYFMLESEENKWKKRGLDLLLIAGFLTTLYVIIESGNSFERGHEYEADGEAARILGCYDDACEALRAAEKDHYAWMDKEGIAREREASILPSRYPTFEQRIANIKKIKDDILTAKHNLEKNI